MTLYPREHLPELSCQAKDFSLGWRGEKQILAASVATSHSDSCRLTLKYPTQCPEPPGTLYYPFR